VILPDGVVAWAHYPARHRLRLEVMPEDTVTHIDPTEIPIEAKTN
jgi:translation initiation factor IF-1